MDHSQKREKILAMAATKNGAPCGVYCSAANELQAEGLIHLGTKRSAVGAISFRLFLTQRKAA